MSPEPPKRGDHPLPCPQSAVSLLQSLFPRAAVRALGITRELAAKGCWGGGQGGPGPLRGVAVTHRALFFAGERDRHPEGESRAWDRRAAPKQQSQSGARGELSQTSTMGECDGRVGDTRGAAAVSLGTLAHSRAH